MLLQANGITGLEIKSPKYKLYFGPGHRTQELGDACIFAIWILSSTFRLTSEHSCCKNNTYENTSLQHTY